MDLVRVKELIRQLGGLNFRGMYDKDVVLTWEKPLPQLQAILLVAEILRGLREANVCCRVFRSGLALSLARNAGGREATHFAAAANLLGLTVQELGPAESPERSEQAGASEALQQRVVMAAGLAECVGVSGADVALTRELGGYLEDARRYGILPVRPAVLSLSSDRDRPAQSLADMLHFINHFGGVEALKGRKLTVAWAYSPQGGGAASTPQAIIGLATRFGLKVTLAHPEGYELAPEVEDAARRNAAITGGDFVRTYSIKQAFKGADIVYALHWPLTAPQTAPEEPLKDWECTEKLMSTTRFGQGLYCHPLPAAVSGLNCARGEVSAQVFERRRTTLLRQASYKPYAIAAMALLARKPNPAETLLALAEAGVKRVL